MDGIERKGGAGFARQAARQPARDRRLCTRHGVPALPQQLRQAAPPPRILQITAMPGIQDADEHPARRLEQRREPAEQCGRSRHQVERREVRGDEIHRWKQCRGRIEEFRVAAFHQPQALRLDVARAAVAHVRAHGRVDVIGVHAPASIGIDARIDARAAAEVEHRAARPSQVQCQFQERGTAHAVVVGRGEGRDVGAARDQRVHRRLPASSMAPRSETMVCTRGGRETIQRRMRLAVSQRVPGTPGTAQAARPP